MTDKQIIIDVCPYQGECSVSGCKRNDDGCFVRQLFEERYRAENQIVELNKKVEAKEQECKKLKEYFETAKEASNCNLKALGEMTEWADKLDEENDQLKAENEELKKCYKNNLALLDFEETNTTKLVNKVMKLEKTLTEIKEYFVKQCEICIEQYAVNDEICKECEIKDILQKISEVENE